jgi:hypothetical protein
MLRWWIKVPNNSSGKLFALDNVREIAWTGLIEYAAQTPGSPEPPDDLLQRLIADTEPVAEQAILMVIDQFEGTDGFCYYLVPLRSKTDDTLPAVIMLDGRTGEVLEVATAADQSGGSFDNRNAIIIVHSDLIIQGLDQRSQNGLLRLQGQQILLKSITLDKYLVWSYTPRTRVPYFPFYRFDITYTQPPSLAKKVETLYVNIADTTFVQSLPEQPAPAGIDLDPMRTYPKRGQ